MKLRVYLDTSIFNFAISTQNVLLEKEATLKLFEEIRAGKFAPYISRVTLDEILRTTDKKRCDGLVEIVEKMSPEELLVTEEVVLLANRYIEAKIIPAKERNDALHIAVAVVYNLDVIVSWNFGHMVKLKTRREVPAINTLMGYKNIEICSPLEVIES